jgi:hypothetical protein
MKPTFVFRLLQSWQATLANGARFLGGAVDRDGLAVVSPAGSPTWSAAFEKWDSEVEVEECSS